MSRAAMSRPSSSPWRVSGRGLRTAALQGLYVVTLGLAVLFAFLGARAVVVGFDFEGTIWDAALAIREGRSPYPAPVAAEVGVGNPALYPTLLLLLAVPLTVLPWSVALALWIALLAAAVAGTLYLLDVRDSRCYLFALASLPVVLGLVLGNATLLLVPLVALAWRWRDRWFRAGVVVGLAIGSKLFLWPLLFWLLGTRRYKAFTAAVIATGVSVLVPWAVIGFDGFSSYPDLLQAAEEVYAVHSYSVATMLSALGAETTVASRGALALGVAIAALAFYAGRRREDSSSVSLAVLAAILGSPIVWPYYYALLLVPIAIARPRFSGVWACLVLFHIVHQLPRGQLDAAELDPGGTACCRPDDVPYDVWLFNHSPPGLWPAVGYAALAIALVLLSRGAFAGVSPVRRQLEEVPNA